MTAERATIQAARIYAGRGWRVIPLHSVADGRCTCRSTKCKAGKHPRVGLGGVHLATTDTDQIRDWWARWPDANVGIATGGASGIIALDVDPYHEGDESLRALEAEHVAVPETPRALTGGGGTHYLLAHPGRPVPNKVNLAGRRGVDLKGDGGYIVAPPSIHQSGRVYAWDAFAHPADLLPAACPEWLLRLADDQPTPERVAYARGPLDGRLSTRVSKLLRTDRRLRERFRRIPGDHADRTPSGVDASLAGLLARRGVAGGEIEAALRASRARADLPPRPQTYFAATVGKALAGRAQ